MRSRTTRRPASTCWLPLERFALSSCRSLLYAVCRVGADRTVLATEVADELGLFHGERAKLEGVVRAVLADTVLIRALSFGSITRSHLVVPTLSRSLLDADGYLADHNGRLGK